MIILRSGEGDDYATISDEATARKQRQPHAHLWGIRRYQEQSRKPIPDRDRAGITMPVRVVDEPDDDEDEQKLIMD